MTLDEAIAKAKADGDVQLAEWMRQARGADAAAKWYTEKLRDANRTIRKLLDENDKLRELCADFYKFSDSICTQFNDCSYCRFMCEDGVNCKYLELFQRVCELRIEVDEC